MKATATRAPWNVEPNDGTLGPTTVAGLLGMVLGARNRLSSWGAPVPKDAFDLSQLEKSIMHFQRQQRLERTGRIDRETFERLHRTVNKTGGADIFAVPRAIKSTVVDLSARAVGSSTGPIDVSAVETLDIEHFARNVLGYTCKYLWQGKPRKSAPGSANDTPPRRNSMDGPGRGSISGDEDLTWTINYPRGQYDSIDSPPTTMSYPLQHVHTGPVLGTTFSSTETSASREATVSDLRKAVFKSMTGRMKDVASGLSAGADYMRGRHQRSAIHDFTEDEVSAPGSPSLNAPTHSLPNPIPATPPSPKLEPQPPPESSASFPTAPGSPAQSVQLPPPPALPCFMRRKSFSVMDVPRHGARLPSRASFSLAAEAVLPWTPLLAEGADDECELQPHYERLQAQLATLEKNMEHLHAVLEDKSLQVGTAQRDGAQGIENERERVRSAVRDAEVLGARMRYEIGVVEGRVMDLEEAVGNLGRFVEEVEAEVAMLEDGEEEMRRRRWWEAAVRLW